MKILGIQDGHNAAIALLDNGNFRFAIQEERLTRVKNAGGFPRQAIDEMLRSCEMDLADIDEFAFVGATSWYRNNSVPDVLRKYDRSFERYGRFSKDNESSARGIRSIARRIVPPSIRRLRGSRISEQTRAVQRRERLAPLAEMGGDLSRSHFVDHHLCHAASAAYGADLTGPVAVVTADASGDGLCGTVSRFENGKLDRQAAIPLDSSIARLYSLTTYFMGMVPMEHEYKLMGMAPYAGHSDQARAIADSLHELFVWNDDGLTYRRRESVPPVYRLGPWLLDRYRFERFDNIAAGLQTFIEEFGVEWIRRIVRTLGIRKLALSGGLFMNVKLNQMIAELEDVDDLFVFPSCGDESNAFGAAYQRHYEVTDRVPSPLHDYYLGSSFDDDEIRCAIDLYSFSRNGVSSSKMPDIDAAVADLLANGEIVARFAEREEFGARALGNRSILAPAGDPRAVQTINHMIKKRDFWMPFAPSSTEPDRYVLNPKKLRSPYMMLTFETVPEKRGELVAAIQEMDKTARVQQVQEHQNARYYGLIDAYKQRSGEAVILNTSFNLHGYPIVHSPDDALTVFDRSGLQNLAIGSYLIRAEAGP